jgi:histidinol dehydrogenase
MRIFKSWVASDRQEIERLMNRSILDRDVEQQLEAIIDDIERRGDQAVAAYTERFDHVEIPPEKLRVEKQAISAARRKAGRELLSVIREIERNLLSYHRRQKPKDWWVDAGNGSKLGERWVPVERVGVYVPGGEAPLVSSVLMGLVPAKVAGVKEIVVCSPPSWKGDMSPHILAACGLLGAQEIYRVGGVQAIAAMAIGTETVRRVDKIVGPGNIYVTMAKKILSGRVGIDILAGPSEVLILADDSADPTFVAADLLSQAEHGTGREVCLLVTDSPRLARRVQQELVSLGRSGREAAFGNEKLLNAITLVVTRGLAQAVKLANDFAAEHVEVMTRKAASVAKRVRNAGAIFVGPYSPVPIGDFYAGPNHVLPTAAAAKFSSGLSVLDFMKKISVISYTRKSLRAALPAVSKMAEVEGLPAHAEAVRIRFDKGRK